MDDPRSDTFSWSSKAVHNSRNNSNQSNSSPVVTIYKNQIEKPLRARLNDLNDFLKKKNS